MKNELRKSHKGIIVGGVIKDDYKDLPEELKKFNYYYKDDNGHVIMAVPESLLEEAKHKGNLDVFEVPMPVKFVLKVGYRMICDHVVVQAEYDRNFGVMIPDEFYEV